MPSSGSTRRGLTKKVVSEFLKANTGSGTTSSKPQSAMPAENQPTPAKSAGSQAPVAENAAGTKPSAKSMPKKKGTSTDAPTPTTPATAKLKPKKLSRRERNQTVKALQDEVDICNELLDKHASDHVRLREVRGFLNSCKRKLKELGANVPRKRTYRPSKG